MNLVNMVLEALKSHREYVQCNMTWECDRQG